MRAAESASSANAERASGEAFVAALVQAASQHRAIRHPYLAALAAGTLPDPPGAVRDLAHQYLAYSCNFPRYLTAVIAHLSSAEQRAALIHNLAEESGDLDESARDALRVAGIEWEWVSGVPHPRLYLRFLAALGMDDTWLATHPCIDDAHIWSSLFLQCCRSGSPAEALGALGIGTEAMVSSYYAPVLSAIRRFTDVSPRDRVFFDLHCNVDDEHGRVLLAIAASFVDGNAAAREDLRRGMLMALTLRAAFYDAMLARALAMPAVQGAAQ